MKKAGLLGLCLAMVLLLNTSVLSTPPIPNMIGLWDGTGQGLHVANGNVFHYFSATLTLDVPAEAGGWPTTPVPGQQGAIFGGSFNLETNSGGLIGETSGFFTGHVSSNGEVNITMHLPTPYYTNIILHSFFGKLSQNGTVLKGVLQESFHGATYEITLHKTS